MSIELLSYYLCSRMCHDLSGSVGATSNCIDILNENENINNISNDLDLAKQSINQAINQLKFYRIAFGVIQKTLNVTDLQDVASLVIPNKRILLEWSTDFVKLKPNPSTLQLILNILLVSKDFIPTGGLIRVDCDLSNIFIKLKSEKIYIDANIINAVKGDLEEGLLSYKIAPSFLIGKIAKENKININCSLIQKNIYQFSVNEEIN